ncbi:MAG TPA: thioredoxin family protein [Kiritimatiellia bacterium]|nr:thioredoxin family protein [Kiritimatiellia bacterium]
MKTLLLALVCTVLLSACGKAPVAPSSDAAPADGRPVLMEFGSTKCKACQEMKPVIDGLRDELSGLIDVIMVDVALEPEQAEQHGIELIPTQIFKGADGRELFRHTGFFSREAILAKWQELGISVAAAP